MNETPTVSKHAPEVPARGAFLRAVIVLVSGSAIAHGLSALALPVLSRLYSPADFGLLAVFSSCLAIIASAACLRYDIAIPLPERDDDALNLLAIALACTAGVATTVGLATTFTADWIARTLGQPSLADYLWLLPAGVLLAGTYSALQYWFVRQKQFHHLAKTRIAQSAFSVGMQIGMGAIGIKPLGLLVGYVMNAGIACVGLTHKLLGQPIQLSWLRMRQLAAEYRRFPKYSTFEALANTAAIQVPIVMIAAIASPAEAGFLMLAMYVMQSPTALIGTAISQAYLSRAATEFRKQNLGTFTAQILGGLLRAGLGPFVAIGILSPMLFTLILGADWHRSGVLVSWMTPWFLMQFLASPISMALHVTGRQRQAFVLQVASLVVRILMVAVAGDIATSMLGEWYAVSGFVVYLSYLVVVLRAVGSTGTELRAAALGSLRTTAAWVAVAMVLAFALDLWVSP